MLLFAESWYFFINWHGVDEMYYMFRKNKKRLKFFANWCHWFCISGPNGYINLINVKNIIVKNTMKYKINGKIWSLKFKKWNNVEHLSIDLVETNLGIIHGYHVNV